MGIRVWIRQGLGFLSLQERLFNINLPKTINPEDYGVVMDQLLSNDTETYFVLDDLGLQYQIVNEFLAEVEEDGLVEYYNHNHVKMLSFPYLEWYDKETGSGFIRHINNEVLYYEATHIDRSNDRYISKAGYIDFLKDVLDLPLPTTYNRMDYGTLVDTHGEVGKDNYVELFFEYDTSTSYCMGVYPKDISIQHLTMLKGHTQVEWVDLAIMNNCFLRVINNEIVLYDNLGSYINITNFLATFLFYFFIDL